MSPKIIDSKLCLMNILVPTHKINIMNAHTFFVMANGKVKSLFISCFVVIYLPITVPAMHFSQLCSKSNVYGATWATTLGEKWDGESSRESVHHLSTGK